MRAPAPPMTAAGKPVADNREKGLMMAKRIELIENGSSTSDAKRWPGGRGSMTVAGTLGGATVTLQTLAGDNTSWVKVVDFTAAEHKSFELAEGRIRAAVTGGAPSGIYAVAVQF